MRRALLLALVVACSASNDAKTFDAPSPEDFMRVSSMLGARCGSLDCHGQMARNFRLYDKFGLRLSPEDFPGGRQDQQEEHDANYLSVLSLEPEILSEVSHDGGKNPERLSLVRKARELESHKGGNALDDLGSPTGESNARHCLYSWLEGKVDAKACFAASTFAKPPGFAGTGTGGTGGTGGGPSGGSGGTQSGGGGTLGGGGGALGGSGGTLGGGGGFGGNTGGSTTNGGTGGSSGTGGGGGCGASGPACPVDFWPGDYDPTCKAPKPPPAGHLSLSKVECQTCHGATGTATQFYFAGVVWHWGGKQGAANIEVGLRDGNTFIYTCTDANGFFSVPLATTPPINWLSVESRIRAELGEKIMPSDKEHKPTCNDSKCHADPLHQIWAP